MSVNLSICVPSFHPEKIPHLVNSITNNFHRDFELIVCGPNCETSTKEYVNFNKRYRIVNIQDFGSPARCCNIAAERATGKYIHFIADDATYLSMSISRAIIKLEQWEGEGRGKSNNHVIVVKYVEGNMPWWMMTIETGLKGYSLNTSYPICKYIEDNWLHFNACYMYRDLFLELGGYDSSIFETAHFASTDLAVRAQRLGLTTELMDEPTFVVTHSPGSQGTHGAIVYAHQSDEVKYQIIYNDPQSLNRTKIDFNNWKESPEKWARR